MFGMSHVMVRCVRRLRRAPSVLGAPTGGSFLVPTYTLVVRPSREAVKGPLQQALRALLAVAEEVVCCFRRDRGLVDSALKKRGEDIRPAG